jgi:hypothetical protein
MTRLIENITSFGSCEQCDDTGVVPVELVQVFDGHEYDRWAGTCACCQEGQRRRSSWVRRRRSWRYDCEVAA